MAMTPKVLFRRDPLAGPEMQRIRWIPVRPHYVRDVAVRLERPSGILLVLAGSGGASTNEQPPYITSSQKAWQIQSGVTIPAELSIDESPLGSGHWIWQAARDMPFVDYEAALISVNGLFS
jgi:hypothetical protein